MDFRNKLVIYLEMKVEDLCFFVTTCTFFFQDKKSCLEIKLIEGKINNICDLIRIYSIKFTRNLIIFKDICIEYLCIVKNVSKENKY